MTTDRERFEHFLGNVDLGGYREKYAPIKIVEMDLDKEIQVLDLLYKVYWEERNFIGFEKFYDRYRDERRSLLEGFREKIGMCDKCFYKGLPARIYRTWASILTQIQAGYVAESVFKGGKVEMSEELDRAGADIRIFYKNKILNCQVKKETYSREVRQRKKSTKKLEGRWRDITYYVPNRDDIKNPFKRNGDYKEPYKRFVGDKRLKLLSNGFVIFTDELFKPIKEEIDKESR